MGRGYSFYIRHPRLASRIGSAMWGSDFAPMHERLARLAELPAGVTVLDAACGAGLALHWLDPSVRYTGVDASASMLARARTVAARRGFGNAAFELADIADIPARDGGAEVCLLFNALHCVPDPPRAVTEAARCLAPGGRLIGSMLTRGASPRADRLLREAARHRRARRNRRRGQVRSRRRRPAAGAAMKAHDPHRLLAVCAVPRGRPRRLGQ